MRAGRHTRQRPETPWFTFRNPGSSASRPCRFAAGPGSAVRSYRPARRSRSRRLAARTLGPSFSLAIPDSTSGPDEAAPVHDLHAFSTTPVTPRRPSLGPSSGVSSTMACPEQEQGRSPDQPARHPWSTVANGPARRSAAPVEPVKAVRQGWQVRCSTAGTSPFRWREIAREAESVTRDAKIAANSGESRSTIGLLGVESGVGGRFVVKPVQESSMGHRCD